MFESLGENLWVPQFAPGPAEGPLVQGRDGRHCGDAGNHDHLAQLALLTVLLGVEARPALAPLTAALRDAGADGDLRVEAELAVALIVGIAVGRTHGALPALAVLKDDDLVSRLLPLLAPGRRPEARS